MGLPLMKNCLLRVGIVFLGAFTVSIAKTASTKIGALIRSVKFLSSEVALYLYISTIRPYMKYCNHACAGVLITTMICWISNRTGYLGVLVLQLLFLLNPLLIVKI